MHLVASSGTIYGVSADEWRGRSGDLRTVRGRSAFRVITPVKWFPIASMDHSVVPREGHRTDRIGWLRAAVLGANDGIVSHGEPDRRRGGRQCGATGPGRGLAGLVAGAMSMAAGEYVWSVPRPTPKQAELETRAARPRRRHPDDERRGAGRAQDVRSRPRPSAVAETVADQLMVVLDALGAHARDELGIVPVTLAARPLQAAWASAAYFRRRRCRCRW